MVREEVFNVEDNPYSRVTPEHLPECLNSKTKQLELAKAMANVFSEQGAKATDATFCKHQGVDSKTVFVSMNEGSDIVIQFRLRSLDTTPFERARSCPGFDQYVPNIRLVAVITDPRDLAKKSWIYASNRIVGKTWTQVVQEQGVHILPKLCNSLGRVLAKGYIQDKSHEAVVRKVLPFLIPFLFTLEPEMKPYRSLAMEILRHQDKISELPLFMAHADLWAGNLIVDPDTHEVMGIVDWEDSFPLPFGIGLHRIQMVAGEDFNSNWQIPNNFEESERAFWAGIMEGSPEHRQNEFQEKAHIIDLAVKMGALTAGFVYQYDDKGHLTLKRDSETGSPLVNGTLPFLLSYEIPFRRGSEKGPYPEEFEWPFEGDEQRQYKWICELHEELGEAGNLFNWGISDKVLWPRLEDLLVNPLPFVVPTVFAQALDFSAILMQCLSPPPSPISELSKSFSY
ncbi:hypothetical protein B0T13DRAFT_486487 [Neurospora crassa]|nr:hypothetical protein B0T13DRAFT_486487 [Neurospora crassa]